MNRGDFSQTTDVPFHVAESLIEVRIMEQLCDAIKASGSNLFKASTALRETTDESVKKLINSIDKFRKSNEKTSIGLIWLTGVIGFSAMVQAIYVVTLLLKK